MQAFVVKLGDMEEHENITKYLPPRAIDSISTGFTMVSRHPHLILFPLFLDLFIWLGPKLRVRNLGLDLFHNFVNTWSAYLAENTNTILTENLQESLEIFLESFNLFSAAVTFPVGIPSLLGLVNTIETPFGAARLLEVSSAWNLVFFLISLSIAGVMLGVLFFRELSLSIDKNESKGPQIKRKSIFFILLNSSLFMVSLTAFIYILFFILVLFTSVVSLFSQPIAQLLLMVGFVTGGWLFLPLIFGAHSIFLYDQPFYKSVLTGYQVMSLSFRYPVSQKEALFSFPKSITYIFLVYILYQGLNLLWRIPESNSWLTLIGVIGHAFMCTALLLSSFQYFSELKNWQQTLKTAQRQTSVFPGTK